MLPDPRFLFIKRSHIYGLTAAALMVGSLSACNTMEGVGEDVKQAGGKLERSAEDNNNYGK